MSIWARGGAFFGMLGLVGLAACAVFPASAWDAEILYQDDFSVLGGTWSRVRDDAGITDYDQGGYRIQVLQPNTQFWSHPGLDVEDVALEVEARTLAGPDENLYGLLCRYQDDRNFYYFLVGADGFFVVGKYKNGEQSFIGMDTFGFHPALQTERAGTHIQVVCAGDALSLSVNGTEIVTAYDDDFTHGDVGLMAGTFDLPGTDVLFDNFVVRKP
jgi:hypothetical protein